MKHQETRASTIKSGYAFLLCLAVVIATVLLSQALPIAEYQIFVQFALILLIGTLVYLLYRFALTVHVYKLNERTLTVYRGEGAHQKTLAVLSDNMILLIAPATYNGPKLPKGEFLSVNACSSPNGKKKGTCIWCDVGATEKYRLYFEPSSELLEKLQQIYPDRFPAEISSPATKE